MREEKEEIAILETIGKTNEALTISLLQIYF